MKRALFATPLIALAAAGCGSSGTSHSTTANSASAPAKPAVSTSVKKTKKATVHHKAAKRHVVHKAKPTPTTTSTASPAPAVAAATPAPAATPTQAPQPVAQPAAVTPVAPTTSAAKPVTPDRPGAGTEEEVQGPDRLRRLLARSPPFRAPAYPQGDPAYPQGEPARIAAVDGLDAGRHDLSRAGALPDPAFGSGVGSGAPGSGFYVVPDRSEGPGRQLP